MYGQLNLNQCLKLDQQTEEPLQCGSHKDTRQSPRELPAQSCEKIIKREEFTDSDVESLLKEQIFLMKFILLIIGFMLLSNVLSKKN